MKADALSPDVFQDIMVLETDASRGWWMALGNYAPSYEGIVFGGNDAWAKLDTGPGILSTITDGSWHNIIVTYNGAGATVDANFALYLDGVSQTLSACGNLPTPAGSYFGGRVGYPNGVKDLHGSLDELVVFDEELSTAWIRFLAAGNLLTDWPLPSGTVIILR